MRVFIVRHGETDYNIAKRCQGILDIPLNQTGLEQAGRIANRLRLEKFDAIYSSPMKRALATIQAIAKFHPDIPIYKEKELREVSFGAWEGLTWEEIEAKFARPRFALSPHDEFIDRSHGGDSLESRLEKLIPVVEKWMKNHQNQTILLSTHGYIKKAILIAFKVAEYNESLQNQRFDNTALTIIKPFDEEKIEVLGNTDHLF